MLRKLALPVFVLGMLASPLAMAQGFFLEARGGSASVDEDEFDDTTTAFEIGGGYRWGNFGIEGGYVSFNDFENEIANLDGAIHSEQPGGPGLRFLELAAAEAGVSLGGFGR